MQAQTTTNKTRKSWIRARIATVCAKCVQIFKRRQSSSGESHSDARTESRSEPTTPLLSSPFEITPPVAISSRSSRSSNPGVPLDAEAELRQEEGRLRRVSAFSNLHERYRVDNVFLRFRLDQNGPLETEPYVDSVHLTIRAHFSNTLDGAVLAVARDQLRSDAFEAGSVSSDASTRALYSHDDNNVASNEEVSDENDGSAEIDGEATWE